MTTIRQLFELQQLDLEIGECYKLISSISNQLGDRATLDAQLEELEARSASLNQLRTQHRSQELDAESKREKVQDLEARIYGGSITNIRELEGYHTEAGFLRTQLKELDDRVLETLIVLEEAQEGVRSLEESCRQGEEDWRLNQQDLSQEKAGLEEKLLSLEIRREELVSRVGQEELKLYEALRKSKGGVALARVERGLCRGCRMALPTHQLQRARVAQQPVLCGSCGRILFVD